jgi:23S rRNA A2030 N6-methylase RlmJ
VANPFFGRIGDVWKHLILLEVLNAERPSRYFESHAGSAMYPLTHSADSDFGVYGFLDRARRSCLLASSQYVKLLSRLPNDGEYPTQYPGFGRARHDAAGKRVALRLLRHRCR